MKALLILLIPCLSYCATTNVSFFQIKNRQQIEKYNSEVIELCREFSGNWITKEYIDIIQATKSPFEAQKNSYKNILIDAKFIDGDFIGISIFTYGDTEVPPISYYKKNNKNEYIFSYSKFEGELIIDSCELDCQKIVFENNGKIKKIILINENYREEFIQLSSTNCDLHLCEVDAYINRLILEGTYVIMNNKREVLTDKLVISKNGHVSGFNDFNRIKLWQFYSEINGIFESDIIQVGKNTSEDLSYFQNDPEKVFYFSIVNNEYILYSLKINFDEYSVEQTEIKYILKKLNH